jgi:hypothetical protein
MTVTVDMLSAEQRRAITHAALCMLSRVWQIPDDNKCPPKADQRSWDTWRIEAEREHVAAYNTI